MSRSRRVKFIISPIPSYISTCSMRRIKVVVIINYWACFELDSLIISSRDFPLTDLLFYSDFIRIFPPAGSSRVFAARLNNAESQF